MCAFLVDIIIIIIILFQLVNDSISCLFDILNHDWRLFVMLIIIIISYWLWDMGISIQVGTRSFVCRLRRNVYLDWSLTSSSHILIVFYPKEDPFAWIRIYHFISRRFDASYLKL